MDARAECRVGRHALHVIASQVITDRGRPAVAAGIDTAPALRRSAQDFECAAECRAIDGAQAVAETRGIFLDVLVKFISGAVGKSHPMSRNQGLKRMSRRLGSDAPAEHRLMRWSR